MDTVLVIWALAALAILLCGIHDIAAITASLRWLKQGEEYTVEHHDHDPFIIILLPVLREQSLIRETLTVFAKLKYPPERLHIFIVTTQKELAQREQAKTKLTSLAKDIASKRYSTSLLIEKYLGLFSEDVLMEKISVAQHQENELEIRQHLFEAFHTYSTTIDLVRECIDQLNQQTATPIFTHLHYPGIDGDVNQQLEYALEQMPLHLIAREVAEAPLYLAVYNADSRPHADTLQLVSRTCNRYYSQYGTYPQALQQSAIFLENISHLGSRMAGLLLQAMAVLQTRWVLSHEIPRLHRQSRSALQYHSGKLGLFQRLTGAEFALCVGHGVFLQYDLAQRLELFSSSNICDDFLWSFRLCIAHVPILPIPLLESAESPTTVKSLIIQKRSWFLGYTEYLRSRMEMLQSEKYDRTAVELVTAHGLIRAIIWLLLSPTIFLAFILPILARSWLMFFFTCVVYTVYGFTTYWTILAELEPLRRISGGKWDPVSLSRLHRITMVLFSLLAFLLESLGLWWCLYQRIGWAFARKPAYRQKTER